jgi:DNA-binding GntR family transcriptional regulator
MDGPAAIQLVRTTSLSSLVEAEVMRMILAGELTAGQQIKEATIAGKLGVGRSSVREALRALEEADLVRIEKNRGAFVREVSDAEATEMYQVREALEALAGEILAPIIREEQLAELTGMVDAMDGHAASNDFEAYFPLNLRFHDRIFQMTGNGALASMYKLLTNRLHTLRRTGLLQGGGFAVSNHEHRAIVEAFARRDPSAAAAALRHHVRAGRSRFKPLLEGAAAAA